MWHWCNTETEALMLLLSSLPLVGFYFKQWHAKWHLKIKTICSNRFHDHSKKQ